MSAHERATQIVNFLILNCLYYYSLYSCLNRGYSLFILLSVCTMPIYLKIATVNCRGIRDRAKRLAFFTHAKTLDVHVLCLQETYSKPQDELVWQNDWGDKIQAVFNSNAEISRKTDAGTALLLNHPSLQFGNIRKDSGGRILTAEIQ